MQYDIPKPTAWTSEALEESRERREWRQSKKILNVNVVGSRGFNDVVATQPSGRPGSLSNVVLNEFLHPYTTEKCETKIRKDSPLEDYRGHTLHLVCGMAKGADEAGLVWAARHPMTIHKYYPEWKEYTQYRPNPAGFIRNRKMALNTDLLFAFWDGNSRGTQHMLRCCKSLNVPIILLKLGGSFWWKSENLKLTWEDQG
jgi:hypothetical protein